MWVVYDSKTLEVYKTFILRADAAKFQKQLKWSQPRHATQVYEIEEFETGKLDSWIIWKTLTK